MSINFNTISPSAGSENPHLPSQITSPTSCSFNPQPHSSSDAFQGIDDALRVVQSCQNGVFPVSPSIPPGVKLALTWNAPRYIPGPQATTSLSTREECELDYHLDPELSLKKVVYVPSLLDDLRLPLERLLSSRTFPEAHPSSGFNTSTDLDRLYDSFFTPRREINSEIHVQETYGGETFTLCSLLATSLMIPSAEWRRDNPFIWTLHPDHPKAKADGRMYSTEKSASFLDPVAQEELQTVKRWMLPSYLSWEFKNLALGSRAQMEYFLSSANMEEFAWPRCKGWDGRGGCSTASHKGKKGIPNICGRPTSFDVNICPEWKFESSGAKFGCKSQVPHPRAKDGQMRTNASRMMTQLWSEAVLDDSTFVCLNAGNFEVLGIRHRATQTLFLSDIVDVVEYPNYIKLKTSFYIAAVLDAYARARNMDSILPSGKLHSSFFKELQGYKGIYPPAVRTKTEGQNGQYLKDFQRLECEAKKDRALQHQYLLSSLNTTKELVIKHNPLLHWLRSDRVAVRPTSDPRDMTGNHAFPHQAPLSLVIQQKLNGRAYSAHLILSGSSSDEVWSSPIVVKVFDRLDYERCYNEWIAYCHLSNNIVPSCYGVFSVTLHYSNECDTDQFFLLLLENGGLSLEDSSKAMTMDECVSLEVKLAMAHNEGFIHTTIQPSHILRNSQGEVRLISFGHACRLPIRRQISCWRAPPVSMGGSSSTHIDEDGLTYFLPHSDPQESVFTQAHITAAGRLCRGAKNDIRGLKLTTGFISPNRPNNTDDLRNHWSPDDIIKD